MSKLYVRHREGLWLSFINSKDELKEFEYSMIPGRVVTLADISTYTGTMKLMLLKLLEEHPEELNCYSSVDLTDPILLSRFVEVVKDPLTVTEGYDTEAWKTAKRDYVNAEQLMGDKKTDVKLRLPLVSVSVEKLLLGL